MRIQFLLFIFNRKNVSANITTNCGLSERRKKAQVFGFYWNFCHASCFLNIITTRILRIHYSGFDAGKNVKVEFSGFAFYKPKKFG